MTPSIATTTDPRPPVHIYAINAAAAADACQEYRYQAQLCRDAISINAIGARTMAPYDPADAYRTLYLALATATQPYSYATSSEVCAAIAEQCAIDARAACTDDADADVLRAKNSSLAADCAHHGIYDYIDDIRRDIDTMYRDIDAAAATITDPAIRAAAATAKADADRMYCTLTTAAAKAAAAK